MTAWKQRISWRSICIRELSPRAGCLQIGGCAKSCRPSVIRAARTLYGLDIRTRQPCMKRPQRNLFIIMSVLAIAYLLATRLPGIVVMYLGAALLALAALLAVWGR